MATWRGSRDPRGGGGGRGRGGGPFRGGAGSSHQSAGSQVFTHPGGGPTPTPDPAVTQTENQVLGNTTTGLANLSLNDTFPTRPSYGSKGTSLVLWANYFTLEPSSKLVLHHHDLTVKPKAAGKKLEQIVRLALQTPELQKFQRDIVTDFKATLIAKLKIEDQTINVPYRAEGEDEPLENALVYAVKLEFKRRLPVADLISYLTSTSLTSHYKEKPEIVQALNILINHHAKSSSDIKTIGSSRSFSTVNGQHDAFDLGTGLKAMRGFFTSVRAATARILLNVNVSHGAFYQDLPLDGLIRDYLNKNGPAKLIFLLKRLRIRVTHLGEKKNRAGSVIIRAKTIFGLATVDDGKELPNRPRVKARGSGAKDVEFWLDQKPEPTSKGASKGASKGTSKGKAKQPAGGRYISVYDYFKNTYNIQIRDPNLPVVNVGTRERPSYLPAQVCVVLPNQPARQQLSPTQTQNMIKFAVRGPAANAASIVSQGLRTAGLSSNVFIQMKSFGIEVSPSLITVQGRVLAEPKVVYGQNKQVNVMGGSWNMVPRGAAALKFSSPGTALGSWSFLYVDMPQTYPNAYKMTLEEMKGIMAEFRRILGEMGIAVAEPLMPRRVEVTSMTDPALESEIAGAARKPLKILFIILPAGPIPVYNYIKQLADVKYGLHTICMVGSKVANGQGRDQYLRNEALKVNLKLGGDNHLVQPQGLGLIAEDKTMVVGIDVTHPSPGSSLRAPSVAAMVASINTRLNQWPGVLDLQAKSRQEMVTSLTKMLESRLALWRQLGKHASLPENILVYRDGVSEGQYETVLDVELPLLRKACQNVYPAPDQTKGLPRITIVIVGKRHHTRFYVTKAADADRSGNSKAGTVVDRGVTEARNWDFFLQSHTAIKGTARPAHYFVLLDEIFRSRYSKDPKNPKNIADELQMVTQSMCYVFGRATKAVSYCAPAYYADILCERSRCYLANLFDESTTDSAAASQVGSDAAGNIPDKEWKVHDRLKNSMFYV